MRTKFFFFSIFIVLGSTVIWGCNHNEKISLDSLLQKMINRDRLARFPEPYYKTAQFSSYDRATEQPGKPSWFANQDRTMFIRADSSRGRKEYVMMDTDGPGAIVRFWMTFAGPGAGQGTLRIYLDHQKEPVIEGNAMDIISGNQLTGAPLSTSVSPQTDYNKRGHNLYLPIPYARHIEVTYQSDNIKKAGATAGGEAVYYQINYRKYEDGTSVKTFSLQQLEQKKATLRHVQQQLEQRDKQAYLNKLRTERLAFDQTLPPDSAMTETLEGPSAIRNIGLKLQAKDIEQALRSTIIEISFDNEQTIWVPIGDFFGTGYQYRPSDTWYNTVTPDSVMNAYWVMPFETQAKIKIHNLGNQNVKLSQTSLEWSDWQWDERSMHFGASWQVRNDLYTGDIFAKNRGAFDINYANLQGQGVYVGDAITLFNTSYAWWGEGDEKVFVDNESFPSDIGTGTEDYYGYAWARPESFTNHPFISQPDGSGNITPGYTVNLRFRSLDAIPFQKQLRVDMEMWHWASTDIDHAVTAFYYLRPGGSSNVDPQPDGARDAVALERSDIISPAVEKGRIEGENMELKDLSAGHIQYQKLEEPNWSGEQQIWWYGGEKGDTLTLLFRSDETGLYHVKGKFTLAPDYGKVRISLNGQTVINSLNGYRKNLGTILKNMGRHELQKGINTLSIEIIGASPTDDKAYWGLDYLEFVK